MKPPMCKLCGHEHGTRDPHVWRDPPVFDSGVVRLPTALPTAKQTETQRVAAWRAKNQERDNARRRDYMRTRRARGRQA